MRFLSTLPAEARESMGALNAALAKWVSAYNLSPHSSIKRAPADAFADEADRLRFVEGGEEALDEAFRNRVKRKVSSDATVRVDHVLYDVPMGLEGERVELRWTPGREGDVWLVTPDGGRRRLAPTDKHANAESGRAKGAYSIDWERGEL